MIKYCKPDLYSHHIFTFELQLIFKDMKKIFFVCFSLVAFSIFAQTKGTPISIGDNYTISSKILNQEREIQVYLPTKYEENKEKNYSVLYVLDGQEYFLHGVAYQDMLRFRDKTPEFIIVGINTDRRRRRELFYKESEKFIGFLKEELIPYIDTNYRTNKEKERLFFGWEMAGGLGLQILAEQESLFSGFILASPTHATEKRVNAIIDLKRDHKIEQFLLVSAGLEEHWITQDTIFQDAIKAENSRYTVFEREDHYTTPFKTIHEGLSDYFSDYKPIRKRSLKAYDDYGGLKALRVYYKKRGRVNYLGE